MEQKVIEQIKSLEATLASLKEISNPSLNSGKPRLEWKQKVVFTEGDFIYRIESVNTAMQRILFSQMCNATGEDLMLEEEILYCGDFCVFTKQRKVEMGNIEPVKSALYRLYPKTMALFEKYNCIFFTGRNFGWDGEKPKVFDYAVNLSYRNDKLYDSNGEVVE